MDPQYARPVEIKEVRADASKAARRLDWEAKTSFEELLKMMVAAEMAKA
jgi:GDPmannose 4,6-dehydratase